MENTTKTLVTKNGSYDYVRTERGVYNGGAAEYVLRYQGHASNGANKGKLVLLRPWAARPDFYFMVSYSDQVCTYAETFRKNPVTGKIEDVTDRMGGDEIICDTSREATHGVLYYRSKRTFDGVAL